MENRKVLVQQFIAILLVIFGAVVLRVIPHPPNIAPIGAIALFGGVYLDKRYALLIPFTAMLISDAIIGFHTTMPFVYLSFFLIGLVGLFLRNRIITIKNLIFASLMSSFGFFIITNFGVWMSSGMYERNISGLTKCFLLALPFFRNTIIGDLMFLGIFAGIYYFITRVIENLQFAKAK